MQESWSATRSKRKKVTKQLLKQHNKNKATNKKIEKDKKDFCNLLMKEVKQKIKDRNNIRDRRIVVLKHIKKGIEAYYKNVANKQEEQRKGEQKQQKEKEKEARTLEALKLKVQTKASLAKQSKLLFFESIVTADVAEKVIDQLRHAEYTEFISESLLYNCEAQPYPLEWKEHFLEVLRGNHHLLLSVCELLWNKLCELLMESMGIGNVSQSNANKTVNNRHNYVFIEYSKYVANSPTLYSQLKEAITRLWQINDLILEEPIQATPKNQQLNNITFSLSPNAAIIKSVTVPQYESQQNNNKTNPWSLNKFLKKISYCFGESILHPFRVSFFYFY